jgi:polar amino acid transport system substrate-binding protein
MQRTLTGLVASWILVVGCGVAAAQTSETIRLTNGEWQPFLSKDVPHHGFASHIVTEAFALVGVEVEYGFFPWKRSMKLAREGTWDGSAIWGTSEERLQQFHFTDTVVSSTYAFFHLTTTAFDWDDYDDLGDLKIGGTVEYFYSDAFDAAEAAGVFRTIRGRTDEVSLKNLLKGRIDVFPGGVMVTYEQIRDTFSPEDAALFTHHAKPIIDKPLFVLLAKVVPGNERMRDLFNDGLRQLKASGRYDQIIADARAGIYAKPK